MHRTHTHSYGSAALRFHVISLRLLDVMASGFMLVATLPLLVICFLVIRTALGGPVLEHHQRRLANGQTLDLLRFRTAGQGGFADDLRRFLRFTRIEDLPRFIDVIRGDLSLIGPDDRRAFRD